ncbi:protein ACTIVITY OF BC1 COMPLEX KINASE 3, chloroplastic-like [Salvia divinorum]|uniref:Protein ACTIVITY OF BC1 COMPLEX KINASE 3, chloroplastic-like n=1 Tax=Salvia divinorum TaxID=28513 RepID=A0ABD1IAD9_SALDI
MIFAVMVKSAQQRGKEGGSKGFRVCTVEVGIAPPHKTVPMICKLRRRQWLEPLMLLSTKYGSRPIKVAQRALEIFAGLGSFAFSLWLDRLRGLLDQNQRRRAVHLRNTFTRLGPTFVKIGQGLSTRPDLCPPLYIEELFSSFFYFSLFCLLYYVMQNISPLFYVST